MSASSNAIERAMYAACRRHLVEIAQLIDKHPEHRFYIAYALLGEAVAFCDSFGIDVEAWLAELRAAEPRPAVLVPPKRRTS